jgi:hypothetical protein
MTERDRMYGVRVKPDLEAAIEADKSVNFGNNASNCMRFYTLLGIEMRRKLGPGFETFMAGYLGADVLDQIKTMAAQP